MKITFTIIIVIIFFFSLCYQSILIDRRASNIPLTPNIFASPSKIKKVSLKHEKYPDYYYRVLNDSITIYYTITKMVPSVYDKATSIGWQIKYENMNEENLSNYLLEELDLFLFTKLGDDNLYTKEKVIFFNEKVNQYLVGSYNKTDDYYYVQYDYPNVYTPYKDKLSFNRFIKDVMIGSPR